MLIHNQRVKEKLSCGYIEKPTPPRQYLCDMIKKNHAIRLMKYRGKIMGMHKSGLSLANIFYMIEKVTFICYLLV